MASMAKIISAISGSVSIIMKYISVIISIMNNGNINGVISIISNNVININNNNGVAIMANNGNNNQRNNQYQRIKLMSMANINMAINNG